MYTTNQSDPRAELQCLHEIPDVSVEGAPLVAPTSALPFAPNRAARRLRCRRSLMVSATWLGAHLAVFGVRSDVAELSGAYSAAQVGSPLGLAIASLMVALGYGRLGLGVSVSMLSALGIGGPLLFAALASCAEGPPTAAETPDMFWSDALACLDLTLSCVAIPLLASAWALWGAFPNKVTWRSALVGAGCGLVSGATVNLHCDSGNSLHVFVGHGVPVALAAVLGAVLLSRWTRT